MTSHKTELLDLLLAATNDGVVDWNVSNSSVRYSERWKMLLGYEAHELVDSPSLWREMSHPDDLPAVEDHLRDHLESFWPFYFTWRLRHKVDGWRWLLCRAITLRDAADAPVRSVSVYTDVTEPMQAQARHQALATALPDVLIWLDVEGRVVETRQAPGGGPACLRDLAVGDRLAARFAPAPLTALLAAIRDAITRRTPIALETQAENGDRLSLRIVPSNDDEALMVARERGG